MGKLHERDLFWRMGFASKESQTILNGTYRDVPNWNHDFERVALTITDYMTDFRPLTADVKVPVLFFYGSKDFMIGAEHHQGVLFQDVLLWRSEVGHFPFIEAKTDLEEAINSYCRKYAPLINR